MGCGVYDVLAGISILVFTSLWVVVFVMASRRENQVRNNCRARPSIAFEKWMQNYSPSYCNHCHIIQIILKNIGSAYGVEPMRLRPDDVLIVDYGPIASIVLDDPLSLAAERICVEIRRSFHVTISSDFSGRTVRDLIDFVVGDVAQKQNR